MLLDPIEHRVYYFFRDLNKLEHERDSSVAGDDDRYVRP